ncbi:MAG: WXG100 family type VII secretion target [Gemmataceae bacterium]|nr:WXG100 family type VII secretion target [Gemmataceae bacterium]
MSQAIIDPAEVRRFAQNLNHFNQELRDRLASLHGQMTGLAATWRDQEHERFTREFEETLHVLSAFLEKSEEHVPVLLRKAEHVEDYFRK